ncbi:MAG: hypothetical protein ACRC06_01385 [Waterburya sp.]
MKALALAFAEQVVDSAAEGIAVVDLAAVGIAYPKGNRPYELIDL